MVYLSIGNVASCTVAVLGLSSILSVVAQDPSDIDGTAVVPFSDFDLTSAIASAESSLGLNGTISSTIDPEEAAPPATRFRKYRKNKRADVPLSTRNAIACATLKLIWPNEVALQGSNSYSLWNDPSFWAAQTYLDPKCVFQPGSANEISLAIRLFKLTGNLFNVVGGGHSAIPGWSNVEGGVLITLAALNGVNIKKGYAEVSAGQRWGETLTTLDAANVASLGGRMGTVGISGLTLGGGISYFTNRHGLVCDQVRGYEVVLANGIITYASASQNKDLFRALKGGSFNFGIVTRFDLYTWPSPGVSSGELTFMQSDFPKLWDVVYNYHTKGAYDDPDTHMISAFVYIGAYQIHVGAFTALRNVTDGNPGVALKPLFDVNPAVVNASTWSFPRTVGSQIVELGAGDATGFRQDMRDFSILPDEDLYKQIWNMWDETITPFKQTPGLLATIAFQPITTNAIAAGVARGGNSLGLEESKTTVIVVNLTHQWTDASIDSDLIAALDKLLAAAIALAKSKNLYHPYYYLNYARKQDNPITGYGAASVKRLQAAKAKWDEDNFFGTQVPGGFKIPS